MQESGKILSCHLIVKVRAGKATDKTFVNPTTKEMERVIVRRKTWNVTN